MTINELRTEIQAAIAANGVQAITGDVLQKILLDMVSVLAAEGSIIETDSVPIYDFRVFKVGGFSSLFVDTPWATPESIVQDLTGGSWDTTVKTEPPYIDFPLAVARLVFDVDADAEPNLSRGAYYAPLLYIPAEQQLVADFFLPEYNSHADMHFYRLWYSYSGTSRGWNFTKTSIH